MRYHWRDGWTFERLPNGSVEIAEGRSSRAVIPPQEWASIVAAMSARGENAETYTAALDAHERR